MAYTPSKDHRRREREQKKADKRRAREEAKAEKLTAEKVAAELAAEEAAKQAAAEKQAQLDAEFEAEFAAELVNGPPLAIKWTKLTINRILWQTYHSVMEFGLALEDMTMGSEDNKEAAKAFVEQRKPNFVGR